MRIVPSSRWVLSAWIIVLILLAFFAKGAFRFRTPTAQPSAFVMSRIVDAGTVMQGEEIVQQFSIENHGAADLQLVTDTVSCNCTRIAVEKARVPPGESGSVSFTIRTSHANGRFNEYVVLKTNDVSQPFLRLEVNASVIAEFVPDVPVVDFGTVALGETASTWILVDVATASSSRIIDVSSTIPEVSAWLDDSSQRQSRIRLDLTSEMVGDLVGNLILRTSSSLTPEWRLPIRGSVTVSPAAVSQ